MRKVSNFSNLNSFSFWILFISIYIVWSLSQTRAAQATVLIHNKKIQTAILKGHHIQVSS